MFLEEGKRYTILARDEYFPLLFAFKRNHPSLNIKLINKNQFINMVSFTFKTDPIPFLLSKGIDYSSAKKYVHIFLVGDLSKSKKVKEIFDSIPKDYFAYDEYGSVEIKRSEVLFLESEEDLELHLLAKRKNIEIKDISLSDLEIKKVDNSHPRIVYFSNKFSQYFYLYSQIRKRLLLHPEDKDKIHLVYSDEADHYFINFCSDLFSLPTLISFKSKLISVPSIKNKVKTIFETQSFSFMEDELKDSALKALNELVDKYNLPSLPFSFAYANLLEILSSTTYGEVSTDRGIAASNDFLLDQEMDNYVTNFKHDVFYHIESDKDVLPDKELLEIGVNPSYVKTALDRRLKLNYLEYNNINVLSRVRQHLNEKLFDSEFIEELGWKKYIELFSNDDTGFYTTKAKELYLSNQLDKAFYYKPYENIRSYDHSFKGIDAKIYDENKVYSLTNLEKYINCPFQYLLDTVIPTANDDPHSRYIGTLIHSMCEKLMRKKYDFDEEWESAKNKYVSSFEKDGYEYTPYDDVILDLLHHRLKRIIPILRRHNSDMSLIEKGNDAEISIYFKLSDGENVYPFKGKIDKIVVTKDPNNTDKDNEKTYYTIIDYKSGAESFILTNTFLGSSVQLPIYYYALSQLDLNNPENTGLKELLGEAIFGGFGIQKVYKSSPREFFADGYFLTEKAVTKYTRLVGVTLDSADYYSSFDSTSVNEKGKIGTYGGNYLYKGTTFISTGEEENQNIVKNSSLKKYNFNDLINDSRNGLIKTIKAISNSEFPIKPAPMGDLSSDNRDMSACKYCQYKDICYHSPSDFTSYRDEINKHYGLTKGGK